MLTGMGKEFKSLKAKEKERPSFAMNIKNMDINYYTSLFNQFQKYWYPKKWHPMVFDTLLRDR